MPATAATFPTGATKKKPVFGGKIDLKKGLLDKVVDKIPKNLLKTTRLKGVIEWYDRVTDPEGELRKAVKLHIKEQILFSALGPHFRNHPITSLADLTMNAPKTLFLWGYNGVWQGEGGVLGFIPGYKSLGYERCLQPKFSKETWERITAQGVREGLPYTRGKLLGIGPKGAPKADRPIWIPRQGFMGGVGRVAERVITHGKWAIFHPVLPLVSLALSADTWAMLGWEDGPRFFQDKDKLPLRDDQGNLVNKLRITTEDGKEWTLHARGGVPVSARKARVFTGRGAGVLNAVSGFSRYAYSARSFFSLKPGTLGALGWESERFPGQLPMYRRLEGRFAQFNRALFYLHPSNWLFGSQTWARLGFTNVYRFHPATLWGRFRRFLKTDIRLIRNLGLLGYARLKGVDFNNWVSLSRNPLARGLLRLRPGWRRLLQNLQGRYAQFVLFHPLALGVRAARFWLLAAKKRADDFWKKIVLGKILKFVFDLVVKGLGWLGGKVASLLGRFGQYVFSRLPPWLQGPLSAIGGKIGSLFSALGAKLAGNTALALGLRVLGFVAAKLVGIAFGIFGWLTMPEIMILELGWKALSWVFGQTVGRLLQAISSRLVASLASRMGIALAQVGWRALLGALLRTAGAWLASSAWSAVAGFFTTTLPTALAAFSSWLVTALAGLTVTSVLVVIGIAVTLAITLFVVTIYVPALFWNPVRGEITAPKLILSVTAKVVPGDVAGASYIGTNKLPVDGLEHTVEYFYRVKNTEKKKATAVQVTDQKIGKTFPLDGQAVEIGPGQEKELGRFTVKVVTDSQRVETNEVLGTGVLEGETVNFSDVGILLIGNPPNAPPCGWPATGILHVLFKDKYPQCPAEAECTGIQIVGWPGDDGLRPSQEVFSTLSGVISQLWYDRKSGGIMRIKGLDGTYEIVFAYLDESSTRGSLRVGNQVNLGQRVGQTYFGPLPNSWDTSVYYQVKKNGDNQDPLKYTPSRPARGETVQAGGCW